MHCLVCTQDGEPTDEHIFPDAIGGSLILKDVCKNCNDYLGRVVDCKLTDHFLVQVQRYMFGVRNRSGRLPNPLSGDMTDDDGKSVRFETDNKGNPKGFKYLPSVDKIDEERIKVSVDQTDSNQLLTIVKKLFKRRGMDCPSDAELLASIQKSVELTDATKKLAVDLIEYQRGLIKIAFELGLHWLGPEYREDAIAKKFHSCLFDPRSFDVVATENKLEGAIELHPPINGSWDDAWRDSPHLHLGFFHATEDGVAGTLRIFDVAYARLRISNHGLDRWGATWPKLVVLDSQTRTYEEFIGEDSVCDAVQKACNQSSDAD